ncbi:hypothetical protein FHJ31_00915 [Pseudomonas sp. Fig-3]|nr:hypothetical protein FHJ31_00915 [Pseudomonas sp. Fig-3]
MGASLLAIAECRSTQMLNGAPSSRAGSLPQWFVWVNIGVVQIITNHLAPPSALLYNCAPCCDGRHLCV